MCAGGVGIGGTRGSSIASSLRADGGCCGAALGSSLRRGMRHLFAGGASIAPWDDPLMTFFWASLGNAGYSFLAVWISGSADVERLSGHEAGCIDGLVAMPLACVILPCSGCGGEVWRLLLLFLPGEVGCPPGTGAT
jgi:hypothetical protein